MTTGQITALVTAVFVFIVLSIYPPLFPPGWSADLAGVACPATPLFASGPAKDQYDDDEAYSVYSAILGLKALGYEVYPSEEPNTKKKMWVISNTTNGPHGHLEDESLRRETALNAYGRMNERSWLFQRKFSLSTPYRLVTPEESGRFDSLITFSAVGFNTDKTVAVVYMTYFCGGLCGYGNIYELKKKIGIWRVVKYHNCINF